jgi:hypothetical protein
MTAGEEASGFPTKGAYEMPVNAQSNRPIADLANE